MGVILLIYVSPLTITCALFERTKGIFENWWKQMLGFILQPMILFAYLGLMLTVFDNLFIGDARFDEQTDDQLLPKLLCTKESPSSLINPGSFNASRISVNNCNNAVLYPIKVPALMYL